LASRFAPAYPFDSVDVFALKAVDCPYMYQQVY